MGDTEPGDKNLDDIIVNIRPGFDLAPSGEALAQTEAALPLRRRNEYILARALATVADRYKWIVIDNSPGLGYLLTNAIVASNFIIPPVNLDSLSVDGLTLFLSTLNSHKEDFEEEAADLLGVAITRADMRSILSNDVLEGLKARPELRTFATIIPERVAVREASLMGKVVTEYAPDNPAAAAYVSLAAEIVARVRAAS